MADSPPREGSFAEELANQDTVMARQSPASMALQPSRRQAKSLAVSGGCSSSEECQDAPLVEGTGGKAVALLCIWTRGTRAKASVTVTLQRNSPRPVLEMTLEALHPCVPTCCLLSSNFLRLWGNQEQGTRCTLHQVVPLTFFQKCKCSSALEEDSACVWRQVGSSGSFLTS